MKKCLITGMAGFLGSHLQDMLIEQGYDVYGIDNMSSGYKSNLNQKAKFTWLDFTNKNNGFHW